MKKNIILFFLCLCTAPAQANIPLVSAALGAVVGAVATIGFKATFWKGSKKNRVALCKRALINALLSAGTCFGLGYGLSHIGMGSEQLPQAGNGNAVPDSNVAAADSCADQPEQRVEADRTQNSQVPQRRDQVRGQAPKFALRCPERKIKIYNNILSKDIIIKNTETQQERTLTGHRGFIQYMSLSQDGALLASNDGHTKCIMLWDVEKAEHIKTLNLNSTYCVRWHIISPDNQTIAVGFYDGTIEIWNMPTDTQQTRLEHKYCDINQLPSGAFQVVFSEESLYLAFATGNQYYYYSAETGEKQ